jgi:hypothetical protein
MEPVASTYLLTWNPAKFHWPDDELTRFVNNSSVGKTLKFRWSCGRTLKPMKGDRVFLIRLGRSGRGIFASGHLHRGASADTDGDFGNAVGVTWDVMLDPRVPENLFDPLNRRNASLKKQMWTPQMSGTAISPEVTTSLERLWAAHCETRRGTTSPSVSTGDRLVVHAFRLRESLQLELSLPSNLTADEAERIGLFVRSVVLGSERPQDTPASSSEEEEKPDQQGAKLPRQSRVGLGPSTARPRGRPMLFPLGVRIQGQLRGGATKGERVGSGHGYVDVGFRLSARDHPRQVRLPAGLTMVSKSTQVQNGLLVQDVHVNVPADSERQWVLAMYCANKARKPADGDTEFVLGPVVDDPALRDLFELLKDKTIPEDKTELVQKAVWEITDDGGLSTESRAELLGL